uniref:Uncharacterized protein n=1 Tax=Papio anubis TaxID=9555 RepID=A0A8I5NA07_PAPAN
MARRVFSCLLFLSIEIDLSVKRWM